MLSQVVCVIATFLYDYNFRANLNKFPCHVEVHEWAQLGPSKLVVNCTVKSARDEDQIWLELPRDREKQLVTGVLVLVAA